jgi:lipopolysaccharide export system permease protein
MRILTRYMLRAHLGPFLFALSILTGLLFINTIAKRFEDLAGKGLPLHVVLEFLYLSLPHIIALTLPMAVLVSTLYAFSTLSADNEIAAIKASGVNLLRLMVPLIVTATLVAGMMVWFNDRLLPETNHRLKSLLLDVGRKNPTLTFRERAINPIQTLNMRTRYFLEPGTIDRTTGWMHAVVIYDLSDPQRARTVYADSGRLAFNESETNLFLALYNGHVTEVDEQKPENFQTVVFAQQFIEVRDVGAEFERGVQHAHRGDREMSVAMLAGQVDSARAELAALRTEATELATNAVRRVLDGPASPGSAPSVGLAPIGRRGLEALGSGYYSMESGGDDLARRIAAETRVLENRINMVKFRRNAYQVEYHKKFAIPFACIVFVLIGAPLAVRFPRGGAGMVIASSLAIFGIYYMSLIGGETLGDNGTIPPWLGPWGPNLLFLGMGIIALARIGRETATARGGGWDDLVYTVGSMLRRPFEGRRPFTRRRPPTRQRAETAT